MGGVTLPTEYIKTSLAIRRGEAAGCNPALESLIAEFERTTADTIFRSGIVSVAAVAVRVFDAREFVSPYVVVAQLDGTATGYTVAGKKGGSAVTFAMKSDEIFALGGLDDYDITVTAVGGTSNFAFFVKGTELIS